MKCSGRLQCLDIVIERRMVYRAVLLGLNVLLDLVMRVKYAVNGEMRNLYMKNLAVLKGLYAMNGGYTNNQQAPRVLGVRVKREVPCDDND